jgi:hypothetical protein
MCRWTRAPPLSLRFYAVGDHNGSRATEYGQCSALGSSFARVDHVVTGSASAKVGASAAIQEIITGPAEQRVLVPPTEDLVFFPPSRRDGPSLRNH